MFEHASVILKWVRRGALALALLLGLALATAPWTVPALVRDQAVPRLAAALGRQVTVGAVTFHPLLLRLRVDDLQVRDAAGRADALSIGRIDARLSWSTLWHLQPRLAALALQRPQVRIVREADGALDFADIARHLAGSNPAGAPAGPPAFVVRDVAIRDGAFEFDDRRAGVRTRVDGIALAVPMISSLDEGRDALRSTWSARVDGAALRADVGGTPFARAPALAMTLGLQGLDLAPFARYLPADAPVRLLGGRGSATLRVSLDPSHPESLDLSGQVGVSDAVLASQAGPLGGWRELRIDIARLQPLRRVVALRAVRVDGLDLQLARGPGGIVGFAAAKPASQAGAAAAPSWHATLDDVLVADSRVEWRDASVHPAVRWTFAAPRVHASRLSWPLDDAAMFDAQLDGPGGMTLRASGRGGAAQGQAELELRGLHPDLAAPYAAAALAGQPMPAGSLALQAQLNWHDGAADARVQDARWSDFSWGSLLRARALTVRGAALDWRARPQALRLTVDDASVDAPSGLGGSVDASRLELRQVAADLAARHAIVGDVQLAQPRASVARDSSGRWSFEALLPAATSSSSGAAGAPAAAPWRIELRRAQVHGGAVYLADTLPAEPMVLMLTRADATLKDAAWPLARPAALHFAAQITDARQAGFDAAPRAAPVASEPAPGGARPPLPLGLGQAVGAEPQTLGTIPDHGTLRFDGRVGAAPWRLRGQLDAQNLPLQLAAAYAPLPSDVRVRRALARASGKVSLRLGPAGPDVDFTGSAGIDHLAADTVQVPGRLLSWRQLDLSALHVARRAGSGQPLQLDVGPVALRDFYARLVLGPDGRLNLSGLAGTTPPPGVGLVPVHAPPAPAAPATAAAPPAPPSAAAPPRVSVAGIEVSGGRIDYTDYFVRPNFATSVMGVAGTIGALRSDRNAPATVDLHGTAQGSAPVSLTGSVDPLRSPPQLDLTGAMRELQLSPLSPYSARYAGYDIARGLLSMNVHYVVDPEGLLRADNHLTLNQLTFGKAVDSPEATHLPVRLAVALLKDRAGNIDIDIPVSGSLHDPHFDLGALIGRALFNLITRAVTAPFTLIGHLFQGAQGEQLSQVAFAPGTANLAPADAPKVQRIAEALRDKTDLIVTITAQVDPAAERAAYRSAVIERQMVNLWKRNLPRAESLAQAKATTVPAPDRDRILAALYRQAALPNKPRTALGLPATVDAATMRAMLEADVQSGDDRMLALAMQRAIDLRNAMTAQGIDGTRVFIGAPVLQAGPPQASLALSLP